MLQIDPVNTSAITSFISSNFSFNEFLSTLQPMLVYVFGIALYALFIFKFYRFMAKQDIVTLDSERYSKGFKGFLEHLSRGVVYVVQNLIVIPLAVFLWFAALTTFLLLLSKTHTPNSVVLTAVATVAVVRITAYYNENLSADLAKMIPFALLGVFLVDATFFSVPEVLSILTQIPALWKSLAYYIMFAVGLEFVLLVGERIVRVFVPKKEKEEK